MVPTVIGGILIGTFFLSAASDATVRRVGDPADTHHGDIRPPGRRKEGSSPVSGCPCQTSGYRCYQERWRRWAGLATPGGNR